MHIIDVFQLLSGIAVIALVLLQQNESGFSSRGSSQVRTRRGPEKLMFNATIFFGASFVILSIINFLG